MQANKVVFSTPQQLSRATIHLSLCFLSSWPGMLKRPWVVYHSPSTPSDSLLNLLESAASWASKVLSLLVLCDFHIHADAAPSKPASDLVSFMGHCGSPRLHQVHTSSRTHDEFWCRSGYGSSGQDYSAIVSPLRTVGPDDSGSNLILESSAGAWALWWFIGWADSKWTPIPLKPSMRSPLDVLWVPNIKYPHPVYWRSQRGEAVIQTTRAILALILRWSCMNSL